MSDLFLVTFIILNQIIIILIALRIKNLGKISVKQVLSGSRRKEDEINWEVQEILGRVQILEKKSRRKRKAA